MTIASMDHGNMLGAGHGQYRNALTASQSRSLGSPDPTDEGTAAGQSRAAFIANGAIQDAGIRAGSIIGYRAWWAPMGRPMRSLIADEVEWYPGYILQTPAVYACFGGFHSFKSIDLVIEEYAWWSFARPMAIGRVAQWGEVIEHENGYRSEYAAVHSIDMIFGEPLLRRLQFWRPSMLKSLRQLYGV